MDKSSLLRYREYKVNRGNIEHLYDNTRGSRLLAAARGGVLRTRIFRATFENIETTCPQCNTAPETLEHIIMECHNNEECEKEVRIRLGLHEESNRQVIENSKRLLERWEKLTA